LAEDVGAFFTSQLVAIFDSETNMVFIDVGENGYIVQPIAETIFYRPDGSGQAWTAAQPAAPYAGRATLYISPVGEGDIRVLLTSDVLFGSAAFLAALSLIWGWRPKTLSGSVAASPRPATLAERS